MVHPSTLWCRKEFRSHFQSFLARWDTRFCRKKSLLVPRNLLVPSKRGEMVYIRLHLVAKYRDFALWLPPVWADKKRRASCLFCVRTGVGKKVGKNCVIFPSHSGVTYLDIFSIFLFFMWGLGEKKNRKTSKTKKKFLGSSFSLGSGTHPGAICQGKEVSFVWLFWYRFDKKQPSFLFDRSDLKWLQWQLRRPWIFHGNKPWSGAPFPTRENTKRWLRPH